MLYVNSCAQSCQSFTHLMSSQFSSLMRCVGSSSKSASTTSIPQSTSIIPSADARDAKRKYDSFRACSTQTASLSPPRTAQQDTIPARCCAGAYHTSLCWPQLQILSSIGRWTGTRTNWHPQLPTLPGSAVTTARAAADAHGGRPDSTVTKQWRHADHARTEKRCGERRGRRASAAAGLSGAGVGLRRRGGDVRDDHQLILALSPSNCRRPPPNRAIRIQIEDLKNREQKRRQEQVITKLQMRRTASADRSTRPDQADENYKEPCFPGMACKS